MVKKRKFLLVLALTLFAVCLSAALPNKSKAQDQVPGKFTDGSVSVLEADIIAMNQIEIKLNQAVNAQEFIKANPVIVEGADIKKIENGGEYGKILEGETDTFILTLKKKIDLQNLPKVTIDGSSSAVSAIAIYKLFDTPEFNKLYTYKGQLGALYTPEETSFYVWSPTAKQIQLKLYKTGDVQKDKNVLATYDMKIGKNGVWRAKVAGDLNGVYYTYVVTQEGRVGTNEVVDPYARAVGVNGNRGMVIDLSKTDPAGFRESERPEFNKNMSEAIIWEIHVRDFSMNKNSGMKNKGKFLAFTELGTKNSFGEPTGVDYLRQLGITHVHILPTYDYATVDETKLNIPQYNWGYDPKNYNAPEGSYSTDPYNGEVRIKEYKQMVQSLHNNGIRVVMDSVYNHTYSAPDSNFHYLVPQYYYRMVDDNTYSNGSACGNETASERPMMRKFIIDSVVYWATQYKLDGFRFDLMGLHDMETMNLIREALNDVDPNIIIYGEPWQAGASTLPLKDAAVKANMYLMNSGIAAFSDDIRDGMKGSVFISTDTGFVNTKYPISDALKERIKFGVVASVAHPQVNYVDKPWANAPTQAIAYDSCHDNLTMWDKLKISRKDASNDELIRLNKLTAAIIFTAQGATFIQSGEEFARSKNGDDNSYKSPDSINELKWDAVHANIDLLNYYKGLIALKNTYGAFSYSTKAQVDKNIKFLDTNSNIVAFRLIDITKNSEYSRFIVIYNGSNEAQTVDLGEDKDRDVLVNELSAQDEAIDIMKGASVIVPPKSALVLGEKRK